MGFREWWEKTFGPEGLFSSGQEGHAFLIGISEVVAFWKPRFKMPEDYEAWLPTKGRLPKNLKPGNPLYEYHYYMFGRACGILVWLIICCVMKAILF
jgi:hypothetical protein